jgi:hypothetical protein
MTAGVWISFSWVLLSLYVVTYVEQLQVNLTKASKQIDRNIPDKVAHFSLEFGTISTVNSTSNFERFKTYLSHVCSLYNFVYAKVFITNFITNYNLGFGNHCFFIRKQCALTLSYNISTAIFKHQIKQSIEIK